MRVPATRAHERLPSEPGLTESDNTWYALLQDRDTEVSHANGKQRHQARAAHLISLNFSSASGDGFLSG